MGHEARYFFEAGRTNLKKLTLEVEHEIEREFIKLNVLNEIKCYILITLMYMPNTCRLVWNKNCMLSEISVKAFRKDDLRTIFR
jgi:hypothetical protein